MIKQLRLQNFRSFEFYEINFNSKVNLILGQNGVGKTSILEALYFFNFGQSFRPGKLSHMIQFGCTQTRGRLEVEYKNENHALTFQMAERKKEFLINQKKCRVRDFKKYFNLVLFSPESLSAIKNGPEIRRNLLDEAVLSLFPKEVETYQVYKKSLKARNKILKDFRQEKISRHEALGLIESWNEYFIKTSSQIVQKRMEVIHIINPVMHNCFVEIMNLQDVDISVDYLISGEKRGELSFQQVYQLFEEKRERLVVPELASGITLFGPQKHDICFVVNATDSRYFCSQGQQRALILAFKVAIVKILRERQLEPPVLLLDDVMSELDEQKREYLLSLLKGLDAQIFLTTTDYDLQNHWDHSSLGVYLIQQADVRQKPNIGALL